MEENKGKAETLCNTPSKCTENPNANHGSMTIRISYSSLRRHHILYVKRPRLPPPNISRVLAPDRSKKSGKVSFRFDPNPTEGSRVGVR